VSLNPAVVYRGLPMAMLNLGGTTAVQFGSTRRPATMFERPPGKR
jgi:hypothetical protein